MFRVPSVAVKCLPLQWNAFRFSEMPSVSVKCLPFQWNALTHTTEIHLHTHYWNTLTHTLLKYTYTYTTEIWRWVWLYFMFQYIILLMPWWFLLLLIIIPYDLDGLIYSRRLNLKKIKEYKYLCQYIILSMVLMIYIIINYYSLWFRRA